MKKIEPITHTKRLYKESVLESKVNQKVNIKFISSLIGDKVEYITLLIILIMTKKIA